MEATLRRVNEHNGKVPRDGWLTETEIVESLRFHDEHPLEGYRRLTFLMLDQDVVAVAPSAVYRVLSQHGRLKRKHWSPSKKGTGFVQPLTSHTHGHIDIAYLNIAGTPAVNRLTHLPIHTPPRTLLSPGETEAGSAGTQPAQG